MPLLPQSNTLFSFHVLIKNMEYVWDSGVSKIMDSHLHCVGQRGNVESKVRVLGKTVFGTTALLACLYNIDIFER